ncbi:MAG: sensor domain-containing diguanylate cyclase [Pseudomonadota bacterium]
MDPIIAQLSAIVPAARSLEELTRPLLAMLAQATGMESTYLTSIDTTADLQKIRYALNAHAAFAIPEGLAVPWGDTLCKRALEEQCNHTDAVADRWGDSDAARALGICTYVSAPIHAANGELLGTLCAASPVHRPLPPEAASLLRLFSTLVGQIMEREQLVEQLAASNAQLALHAMTDPLTGLPNRRALVGELQRMLARAEREGSCVLVGIADLDGFKSINDRHGHAVGDAFLKHMSKRLSGALRATDLVGRLGGDEFVILGPGPALLDGDQAPARASAGAVVGSQAARTATQTLQARCASATVGGFTHAASSFHYAGASVGIVPIDPRFADADHALRLADAAMYETKRARRLPQPA